MSEWIDFRKLRRDLNFEKILTAYGVRLNIRDIAKDRQHSGPCPLTACKERSKANFSANVDQGIWRCFGCGGHGNTLDFVLLMEGLDPSKGGDVRKGALFAQEKFMGKDAEKPKAFPPQTEKKKVTSTSPPLEYAKTLINEPLDFTLKSLDPSHGWFKVHGFKAETLKHFGLGASSRGALKGKMAIPLVSDATGKLIGYAGRLFDEGAAAGKDPRYLFPEPRIRNGIRHIFEPGRILYNSHAINAPVNRLLVVSDMQAVWWLWQHGYGNVVSTMRLSCEDAQAKRALSLLSQSGTIAVLARESEDGSRFARAVMEKCAITCAVRWYATEAEPSSLDAIALQALLGLAETSVS
jgi:hypothetical protein